MGFTETLANMRLGFLMYLVFGLVACQGRPKHRSGLVSRGDNTPRHGSQSLDQRGTQFTQGTVFARDSKPRGAARQVDGKWLEFVPDVQDKENGVAWGTFDPAGMYTTGWSAMSLASNPAAEDRHATFAVGYLEGALTHRFNHAYYHNMLSAGMRFPSGLPETVQTYYDKHENWVRQQLNGGSADLERNPTDGSYWQHVGLVMNQYDGLLHGHNDFCEHGQQLKSHQMHILAGQLDLLDLRDAYTSNGHGEAAPKWFSRRSSSLERGDEKTEAEKEVGEMSLEPQWYARGSTSPAQLSSEERERLIGQISDDPDTGHACSTYMTLTQDQGSPDVLIGHSTWAPYSTIMRIYKHIDMPLQHPDAAIKEQMFAAFPGGAFVGSYDTYALLKGKQEGATGTSSLLNMEREEGAGQPLLATAGGQFWVNNKPKLNLLNPEGSLMGWIRMAVASRTSASAEEFAHNFAHQHGSTYAGQLYIVDYNKVNRKGQGELPPKSVMYVETCPTKKQVLDHTNKLMDDKYLSTFNHPITEDIRDFTHGGGLERDRDMTARKSASGTQDAEEMKQVLMTSLGSQDNYGAYGAIDGKVVNGRMAARMETHAKSGVQQSYTLPKEGLVPFAHELLPDNLSNQWETVSPNFAGFQEPDPDYEEQMPVDARPVYNPETALQLMA